MVGTRSPDLLKVRVTVMAQSPQGILPGQGAISRPLQGQLLTPGGSSPPLAQGRRSGPGASVVWKLPGGGLHPHLRSGAGRPATLTVGCSHEPPASHAVQPDGGALGEGARPQPGRHRAVGRHLVRGHGRPGSWLQRKGEAVRRGRK